MAISDDKFEGTIILACSIIVVAVCGITAYDHVFIIYLMCMIHLRVLTTLIGVANYTPFDCFFRLRMFQENPMLSSKSIFS